MVVQELFARLGLDVDPEGFERAESMFEVLHGGWAKVALGAAAVIGAFLEIARETAEAGEEASHAAQRLGLTTDAYQELAHAANMAGVEQAELETAMFHMSRAAEEARKGSTAAGAAFKGLLTLSDLKNLTPDQQLEKMADGFLHIKDQGQRADKIMAIFGRSGKALIPLLNKGTEGIEELKQEAHELGLVQSEESIKADEEFVEGQRRMMASIKGLRNEIGNFLIPRLLRFSKWVKQIAKDFSDWRAKHMDKIIGTIKLAVLLVTAAILAMGLANAGVIASMLSWWVALRIGAVVNAIRVAAAWAIANAPLLLMIATIAVVLLWLEDLYQFLTGGDSVIGDFVDTIKDALVGPDGFKGLVMDVVRWFMQIFPDSISDAATRAAGWLVDKFTAGIAKVKAFFNGIGGKIGNFIMGADTTAGGNGFSGGASSPVASVASSPGALGSGGAGKVVSVNAPNNITINTHPGMSADDIVSAQQRAIEEHEAKVNRETEMAAP